MPGRMESVENLVAAAVPGSRNRGWFSTLPTAPWKSLRDSHSSTAPTMTILSYHQGDTSTGLPKGTFLLGLDTVWQGGSVTIDFDDFNYTSGQDIGDAVIEDPTNAGENVFNGNSPASIVSLSEWRIDAPPTPTMRFNLRCETSRQRMLIRWSMHDQTGTGRGSPWSLYFLAVGN